MASLSEAAGQHLERGAARHAPVSVGRRADAVVIAVVWGAWASLSLFVAPSYGDRGIYEQLFSSAYAVAVGAAIGFCLFDRLPSDGFGLFAARATAALLFAVLFSEAVVEPLLFGLEPISRAGVYYALTDGLSITIVFILIRLGQRVSLLRDDQQARTASNGDPAESRLTEQCFLARIAGGARRIYPSDVIYMQAERDFTRIVCLQGEYFVSENLKCLVAKSAKFGLVRVHKSFAVNLRQVDQLTRSKVQAAGRSLPVGRRHWPDVAMAWRGLHPPD